MAEVFEFLGERFDPERIMAAHTTYFNGVLSDQVAERPQDEARNHEQLRAYQLSHGVFDGRFRWLQPPPRWWTPPRWPALLWPCSHRR